MANEKEPLPARPPQTAESKQTTAEGGRSTGRGSLRGSGTMASRFGSLAGVFKRKSESGDKAADKFRRAATDKNRAKQESVLEKNNLSLQTAALLQEEQNDLLRQIIDQLKGYRPSAAGGDQDGDVSLDVDVDRRNRGRGQRGRFGSKGRERLRRRQAARRAKQFQRIRGTASRSYTAVRKAAAGGAERVRAAARSVAERIRPPSAPATRPPVPGPTTPAARPPVPSAVGQAAARVLPSLGAAAAPAAAAVVGAASLGVIGAAAYRAATMSPEERQAIQQRAEEQAAAGRQALTEGQQSGRGVGQGLRAGYYGDQPADLRLEDILDTLDTPAQNETPEQRTSRERMANQLTRGNGRPTPEMIEYVRSRRASSQPATQTQAPPPAVPPRQGGRPDQDALTRQGSQFLSAFEGAELAEADIKDFEERHGRPDTTRYVRSRPGTTDLALPTQVYSDPELQSQYQELQNRQNQEEREGSRVRREAMTALAGPIERRGLTETRRNVAPVLMQKYGYTREQLSEAVDRGGFQALERLLEQEVQQDLLNRGRVARGFASLSDEPGAETAAQVSAITNQQAPTPPPVTPAQPPAPALGEGAGAAAVDDPGSFGLEPVAPPATQVQPPPTAAAPRIGNVLSRLFSRSSAPRQAPVLGQGGEAAAVGDVGAMGLQRAPARREVPKTIADAQRLWRRGQVEDLSALVHARLRAAQQPERYEEVMEAMIRMLPDGLSFSNFRNESLLRDYLIANPGRRTEAHELMGPLGEAMQGGGQETLRLLEQQQSGAQATPAQSQSVDPVAPAQKDPVEPEPQPAAEPKADTQGLVTRLSSGSGAPMPKSTDDYKAPSEPMAKSPITTMVKGEAGLTNSVQSLLSMLSGTEFHEIKIEAEKFEFDGRVSLSAAEASLVTPTAAPFRGYGDLVPEMSRLQSPGATGSMGSIGGQSSAPGPSQAGGAAAEGTGSMGGATDSGSTGGGGGGSASPVSTSPASPAVSGGSEGAAGSGEGAISQVIQAGPGFNMVQYDDGRIERRTGSRNWRNNNPGNLEFGDFSRRYGALGSDGRFAIFPTYEAGLRAKEALLFEGRGYAGMTIAQAITRYAPPNENDTAMYIRTVSAAVGASPTTLMSDLNPDQRKALLASMERVEGFRVGRVEVVQPGTAVASAAGAPPASGAGLATESAGMAAADQAQTMGAGQQVVVQMPPRQESEQQRIAPTAAVQAVRGEVPLNRRLEKQVA